MRLEMEPKVSPPPLPPEVAPAQLRAREALEALVALARALGTPDTVPSVLARAQAVLAQAQEALGALEGAWQAVEGPAVALGTLGDEDTEELRLRAAALEEAAAALEREERRARRRQRWLRAWHRLCLGLMVLCAVLLSLDSVCTALGVTKDSQLPLALAVVAMLCEMALRGLRTSRRHLATAAGHQRDAAQRLRDRARRVVAARARAEASAATAEAIADALGRLEVAVHVLDTLVAAVTEDGKAAQGGMRGQGFPKSTRVLEDNLVSLGTRGDEEVRQKLEVARGALAGLE